MPFLKHMMKAMAGVYGVDLRMLLGVVRSARR